MTGSPLQHLPDGSLGHQEEPRQVHPHDGPVILGGVVGKRLRYVDPGVVDEGVDPSEVLDGLTHDPISRRRFRDVAVDHHHLRVVWGFHGQRAGNDGPPSLPVTRHDPGADAS
jgi:hypothetical protein